MEGVKIMPFHFLKETSDPHSHDFMIYFEILCVGGWRCRRRVWWCKNLIRSQFPMYAIYHIEFTRFRGHVLSLGVKTFQPPPPQDQAGPKLRYWHRDETNVQLQRPKLGFIYKTGGGANETQVQIIRAAELITKDKK